MALELKRQTVENEVVIAAQRAQLNLQADAMVSGAGRDAAETLMEHAEVTITSVQVQNGRLAVEGTVVCQAAYRQRDSDMIRAVEARAPLTHVFEDEAILSGMNGKAEASVTHVEAGFLNGRILFRVMVEIDSTVTSVASAEVLTDIAGTEGVECRIEETDTVRCSAEAVAETTLTETLALPKELETQSTLMDFATVNVEKTERDLGGVRVSGHVNAEVLISGGMPGRPVAMVKYPMPFSQLVEMPEWLTEDVQAAADVTAIRSTLTEAGEGGEVGLRLDCDLRIRVRALQTQHVRSITDAYATGNTELVAELQQLRFTRSLQQEEFSGTFRGTLLIPAAQPQVGTVLAAHALASVTGTVRENDADVFEGVVEAAVIYMPAGGERPVTVRDELPFRIGCGKHVPEGAVVHVSVNACEASALMSDRIEIRCALRFAYAAREESDMLAAANVYETATEARRPGIVMVWPGAGDSAWSIGRRYRIPVADVQEEAGGDVQPGKALVLRI